MTFPLPKSATRQTIDSAFDSGYFQRKRPIYGGVEPLPSHDDRKDSKDSKVVPGGPQPKAKATVGGQNPFAHPPEAPSRVDYVAVSPLGNAPKDEGKYTTSARPLVPPPGLPVGNVPRRTLLPGTNLGPFGAITSATASQKTPARLVGVPIAAQGAGAVEPTGASAAADGGRILVDLTFFEPPMHQIAESPPAVAILGSHAEAFEATFLGVNLNAHLSPALAQALKYADQVAGRRKPV